METMKLRVTGNQIEVAERPAVITAGTVGLAVEFTFDSQWDGLAKTAVFKAGDKVISTALTGNSRIVPWEVLAQPNLWLCIGVYGSNAKGTVVIPTLWARVAVIHTGADPEGDPAMEPTAPVWQEALARLEGVTAESVGAATREEMDAVQGHLLSLQDTVDSHKESAGNPHGVTAEQIGAVTQEKHDTDIGELRGWAEDEIALQVESMEHLISTHKQDVENPHKITCEQISAVTKEELEANKALLVTVSGTTPSVTNEDIYNAVLAGRVVYLKMWSGTYIRLNYCTSTEAVFEASLMKSCAGADGKDHPGQNFRVFTIQNNVWRQNSVTMPGQAYIDAQIAYYFGNKEELL